MFHLKLSLILYYNNSSLQIFLDVTFLKYGTYFVSILNGTFKRNFKRKTIIHLHLMFKGLHDIKYNIKFDNKTIVPKDEECFMEPIENVDSMNIHVIPEIPKIDFSQQQEEYVIKVKQNVAEFIESFDKHCETYENAMTKKREILLFLDQAKEAIKIEESMKKKIGDIDLSSLISSIEKCLLPHIEECANELLSSASLPIFDFNGSCLLFAFEDYLTLIEVNNKSNHLSFSSPAGENVISICLLSGKSFVFATKLHLFIYKEAKFIKKVNVNTIIKKLVYNRLSDFSFFMLGSNGTLLLYVGDGIDAPYYALVNQKVDDFDISNDCIALLCGNSVSVYRNDICLVREPNGKLRGLDPFLISKFELKENSPDSFFISSHNGDIRVHVTYKTESRSQRMISYEKNGEIVDEKEVLLIFGGEEISYVSMKYEIVVNRSISPVQVVPTFAKFTNGLLSVVYQQEVLIYRMDCFLSQSSLHEEAVNCAFDEAMLCDDKLLKLIQKMKLK